MNIIDRQIDRRNSSIESMKVLAIVMIVLSHSMPDDVSDLLGTININVATTDMQIFIAGLIKNLGQIANTIFIVASSYFLLDSKKIKKEKILYMISDCFLISVMWLLIFLLSGYQIDGKTIIKQFFPVTFGNCWFLTTYLLFYSIHPFLNLIIKHVSQKIHLFICLDFFLLYFVLNFLISGLFNFSNVIGFVGIYLMVAYMRIYLKEFSDSLKINVICLAAAVLSWIFIQLLTNSLGLYTSILNGICQRWNVFYNPVFLLIGFSFLNISKMYCFKNKFINYFSGLSLLIYMIHTNRLVRDYFRFDLFEFIAIKYTLDDILMWIILYASISLLLSFLVASLYKASVQKIVYKQCDKLAKVLNYMADIIFKYISRIK